MRPKEPCVSRRELVSLGLTGPAHINPTSAELYEHAIRRSEGRIAHEGPLVTVTGSHTGRAPRDRFIVDESTTRDRIDWGDVNRSIAAEKFDRLRERMIAWLSAREVFVQERAAGAHPRHRRGIRVVTEFAWHSLFARNMFLPWDEEDGEFSPDYTILCAPGFTADPATDGTNSGTFVILNFARRMVLIGGTSYAGEIKKSVFTLLNFLLPDEDVMPMHCSANLGADGTSALFFGLSGTGKTTLSADPKRVLIGDDEHGWAPDGIFNFENGCYAKVIRLSAEGEPEIFATTQRFGTILENVVMDPETRRLDLDDDSLTENTRGSYPLTHIPNARPGGVYPHPKSLIMLTCDAFGVLPPIARLDTNEAMYHFLSGYTAKVAGTEKGLGNEPSATFSTCFGAPFMVWPPTRYAGLLEQYVEKHKTACWLVNTGWTGGPYGVGKRISLRHTRAIVSAIVGGALTGAKVERDAVFGLAVPLEIPGVPNELLDARSTWPDISAYDRKAAELAELFRKNFARFTGPVADRYRPFGPHD
ncbi:phosphoenolpyruvate carboxykinase (ATP) [bacterium]|nr:phosphoenolpyruvate carboxykinase (ATP) [bacterium]